MPEFTNYDDIQWLRSGEAVSGGDAETPDSGNANRPLRQLHINDQHLLERIVTLETTSLQETSLTLDLEGQPRTATGGTYTSTAQLASDINALFGVRESASGSAATLAAHRHLTTPSGFHGTWENPVSSDSAGSETYDHIRCASSGKVFLDVEAFRSKVSVAGHSFVVSGILNGDAHNVIYATERASGTAAVAPVLHAAPNPVTNHDVFELDETRVTRQDLVFLEFWEETVSGTDGKAFLYGNTQYGNASADADPDHGIDYGHTNSGTVSVTDVDFKDLLANPHAHLRVLTSGNYGQWRFRVRTVESVRRMEDAAPQGSESEGNGSYRFIRVADASLGTDGGLYAGYRSDTSSLHVPANQLSPTYAIPVACIHRRNKGIFHVDLNPNGTARAVSGASLTTMDDCFNPDNILAWNPATRQGAALSAKGIGGEDEPEDAGVGANAGWYRSGYSVSKVSGRPDDLFYDVVSPNDILDLRHSVVENGRDFEALLMRSLTALFRGDLKTEWTDLKQLGPSSDYSESSGIYGTEHLWCDYIGSELTLTADTSTARLLKFGSRLFDEDDPSSLKIDNLPDGVRKNWSDAEWVQAVAEIVTTLNEANTWAQVQAASATDGWVNVATQHRFPDGGHFDIDYYYDNSVSEGSREGAITKIRIQLGSHLSGDFPGTSGGRQRVEFAGPDAGAGREYVVSYSAGSTDPNDMTLIDAEDIIVTLSPAEDDPPISTNTPSRTIVIDFSADPITFNQGSGAVNLAIPFWLRYTYGIGLSHPTRDWYIVDDPEGRCETPRVNGVRTDNVDYVDAALHWCVEANTGGPFTLANGASKTFYLDDIVAPRYVGQNVRPIVSVRTNNRWWRSDWTDDPTYDMLGDGVDVVWNEAERYVRMTNNSGSGLTSCEIRIWITDPSGYIYDAERTTKTIHRSAVRAVQTVKNTGFAWTGFKDENSVDNRAVDLSLVYTHPQPEILGIWIKDAEGTRHLSYLTLSASQEEYVEEDESRYAMRYPRISYDFATQNPAVQNNAGSDYSLLSNCEAELFYVRGDASNPWHGAEVGASGEDWIRCYYKVTPKTVFRGEAGESVVGILPQRDLVVSTAGTQSARRAYNRATEAYTTGDYRSFKYLHDYINKTYPSYRYNPNSDVLIYHRIYTEALEIYGVGDGGATDLYAVTDPVTPEVDNSAIVLPVSRVSRVQSSYSSIPYDDGFSSLYTAYRTRRDYVGWTRKLVYRVPLESESLPLPSGDGNGGLATNVIQQRWASDHYVDVFDGTPLMALLPNMYVSGGEALGVVVEFSDWGNSLDHGNFVESRFRLFGRPLVLETI